MNTPAVQLSTGEAAAAIRAKKLTVPQYAKELFDRFDVDLKFSNLTAGTWSSETVKKAIDAGIAASSKPASILLPQPKPVVIEGAEGVNSIITSNGSLAGIPFLTSPEFDIAGKSTTAGSTVFLSGQATLDADVVTSLKNEGAIFVGHSNCSEFHGSTTGNNPNYNGIIKNPFTALGCTGGTHGGAAAAVAGRMVPFALAIDTFGDSIAPSAVCGIVGYRPSIGRYSKQGTLSLSETLESVAVMARTVEEVQLIDACICSNRKDKASVGSSNIEWSNSSNENSLTAIIKDLPGGTDTVQLPSAVKEAATAAVSQCCNEDTEVSENAKTVQVEAKQRLRALVAVSDEPHREPGEEDSNGNPLPSVSSLISSLSTPLIQSLDGIRIGVPRKAYFHGLDPQLAEATDAVLTRIEKAGAQLIDIDFDVDGTNSNTDTITLATRHVLDKLVNDAVYPILGYESIRSLQDYINTHTSAPPPPKKKKEDDEEEVEEEVEDEGKKKPVWSPSPLDTVLPISTAINGIRTNPLISALLSAQLSPKTQVPLSAYKKALFNKLPVLQTVFSSTFDKYNVDFIIYPTTPIASSVPRGSDFTLVELHTGEVADATAVYLRNVKAAAVAGLPSVTVPVGLTKPRPAAPKGTIGADRLPVGIELVARDKQDEKLLAVAKSVQKLQSLLTDPVAVHRWHEGVSLPTANRTS